ncbi:MAG TPA: DUF2207 domain-containing protein [Actinomycetota bacterium]
MRRLRVLGPTLCAGIAAVAMVLGAGPASGQADERIPRYDVRIQIQRDDSITIRETIAYDFGSQQRHGIYRDVPTRLRYDDTYDRIYPLTVLSVTGSPGTPVQYTTESIEGGITRIKVGDPDRTIQGRHTYELTYRIGAALNGFPDHDELYWNAIGDDWPVPIDRATVRVSGPGAVERVACFSGPTGSNLPCGSAKLRDGIATFAQQDLPAHQALAVVAGMPKGVVASPAPVLEERWSVDRAFSATPPIAGAFFGLLVLVLAGFGTLVWRTGRDRRFVGSQVDVVMGAPPGTPDRAVPLFEGGTAPVEFAPPEDLRPGQIGRCSTRSPIRST